MIRMLSTSLFKKPYTSDFDKLIYAGKTSSLKRETKIFLFFFLKRSLKQGGGNIFANARIKIAYCLADFTKKREQKGNTRLKKVLTQQNSNFFFVSPITNSTTLSTFFLQKIKMSSGQL